MVDTKISDKQESRDKLKSVFDLIDIIVVFWNKRVQIIIITSIFIISGLLYALLATNWYMAQVKIMPSLSQDKASGKFSHLASLAGINLNSSSSDNYELYPDIVKSNFILDRLIDQKFNSQILGREVTLFEFLGVKIDSSKKNWKHIEREKLKKNLRTNYILSDINEQNGLLTIKVLAPKEPEISSQMANFIVSQLEIYNKEFRYNKARDQRKYIEKSVFDAKKGLSQEETALQKFLEKNSDYSAPKKQIQYKHLEAEYNVQKTIYTDLRRKLELAKISEIEETPILNILESAIVPTEKYKPKRSVIMILFTIVGFIIGLLYVSMVRYILYVKSSLNKKLVS